MIEFLRGTYQYSGNDYIALEVQGVGYRVYVTNPFRFTQGEEVFLYIEDVIREDARLLYGFLTKEERDLFRLLLEVSGIGPKAGLAIVSAGTPQEIVSAIEGENLAFLTRLPGIGKKTAQRLILDLKDKVKRLGLVEMPHGSDSRDRIPSSVSQEAIAALMALGYNEEESAWAIREVEKEAQSAMWTVEEWIKRALQMMLRR
jgi:Holliday junction DNA helicase RuvA